MAGLPKVWSAWGITAVISTFPLVPLLKYLGRPASGVPAYLSALMILLAVRSRWELSDRPWFWIAVAAIVAVHLPLIWFVPWGNGWIPALIKMPFCFADFFFVSAIIDFAAEHFNHVET
jgi:hypothetical protein